MKKIVLSTLAIGICLTSFGQPSEQGWDVYNSTDVGPNTEIGIAVFTGGNFNPNSHPNLFLAPGAQKVPGWPLVANTNLNVNVCWAVDTGFGCVSGIVPAENICYTNKASASVIVTGTCNFNGVGGCFNSPTVQVESPC